MKAHSVVRQVQKARLKIVAAHVQIEQKRHAEAAKSYRDAIEILEGVVNEDGDYASMLASIKSEYSNLMKLMGREQN